MRVGLVAVGTELLSGVITNGNAAWLGQALTGAGVEVSRSVAVGDDVTDITAALTEELDRADAVVVTGGIGPTSDDRTRDALARLAGVPLRQDDEQAERLRRWFADRGRALPEQALRQADVPQGARILDNLHGSAPGLAVEVHGRVVYALPGVPAEMRQMATALVLPDLAARAGDGPVVRARTVRTAGAGETLVAGLLAEIEADAETDERVGTEVAYLASPGQVQVRLLVRGDDESALEARLDELVGQVRQRLGDLAFGQGEESLDVVIHRQLAAAGSTVAVAESLTGGLLGAALSEMPGSSGTYRGGVVAYATQLKADLLGVDTGLLDRHGPVHPQVAVQMAAGVRERLGATYGVATTGVAGPEPSGGPVGTVHLAVAGPSGPDGAAVRTLAERGDRDLIRQRTVVSALDLLRRVLGGLPTSYREESGRR